MRNPWKCRQFHGSKRNDQLLRARRNTHLASRYGQLALGYFGFLAVACHSPTQTTQNEPAASGWQPSVSDGVAASPVEQAACLGYDGSWRCPALRRPAPKLGVSTSPITPASWNVPTWYINGSTGADSNSCTSSGSPCKTWGEIAYHRWGTTSPIHSVNVAFNITGSQTSPGSDPVIYKPILSVIGGADAAAETPVYVTFTGTLTAGSATTFTLISAKTRSSNTRFRGTFSVTPTVEQLLQNTTHPSYAWDTLSANNITQPLTATSISSNSFSTIGTEVDTWATSDSVTPNTMPSFNFMDVEPIMACLQGSCGVTITHILVPENISAGTQPGDDQVVFGDAVQLIENVFEKQVVFTQRRVNYIQSYTCINNAFVSGILTSPPAANSIVSSNDNVSMSVNAGYLFPQGALAGTGSVQLTNTLLDYDVWLKTSGSAPLQLRGLNYAGLVEFESKALIQYGVFDVTSTEASGNTVWGASGTLDSGNGWVIYASGASGAANSIPITNLKIGGGTVCSQEIPSSATPFTGNKTVSAAAALDTLLGATSGSCQAGGSGFKNFGN